MNQNYHFPSLQNTSNLRSTNSFQSNRQQTSSFSPFSNTPRTFIFPNHSINPYSSTSLSSDFASANHSSHPVHLIHSIHLGHFQQPRPFYQSDNYYYPSPDDHNDMCSHPNNTFPNPEQIHTTRLLKRPYSALEDYSTDTDDDTASQRTPTPTPAPLHNNNNTHIYNNISSINNTNTQLDYKDCKRRRNASYAGHENSHGNAPHVTQHPRSHSTLGFPGFKSNLDLLSEASFKHEIYKHTAVTCNATNTIANNGKREISGNFGNLEKPKKCTNTDHKVTKSQSNTLRSKFLFSSHIYKVKTPLELDCLEALLKDPRYGGKVMVSRKRKQARTDTTVTEIPIVESDVGNGNADIVIGNNNNNNDIGASVLNNICSQESEFKEKSIMSPPITPGSKRNDAVNKADLFEGVGNSDATGSPKKRTSQGRPFSAEMDVEVIIAESLDNLYDILCTKTVVPTCHKVKLRAGYEKPNNLNNNSINININSKYNGNSYSRRFSNKKWKSKRAQDEVSDCPVFGNSFDMVQHLCGSADSPLSSTGFSLVTPIRQSSTQRPSSSKKGTCPVVKFTLTPVTDYSVRFLKQMAYPRYKAEMKVYIVPYQVEKEVSYYTQPALYLQDEIVRRELGVSNTEEAWIFGKGKWTELPNAEYQKRESESETSDSGEEDESEDEKKEGEEISNKQKNGQNVEKEEEKEVDISRKNSLNFILN